MKDRPNGFNNFFREPFLYNEGYGYAVAARNESEALEKYYAYFADWHWITDDHRKYLKAELRNNIKEAYVKWHGFIDDDGEMHNGWVIYWTLPMNTRGFKAVYTSNFEKHYVEEGHHAERQVDEDGRTKWSSDCSICLKHIR